jgi:phage repressor protein C with HTH and peptisase S24 domain
MVTADPRARLQLLSRQRGVSLAQLSALIGRNSSYLQQFVRKGSPRKLEETDRRTLADFFGVGEAELGAPEEIYRDAGGKPARGEWLDVPRLPLGASAGPGSFAPGEAPIGALRFSARWLREQGLDPRMLSAIAVAGDSMDPTLRDGDEILVDRAPRPLGNGVHVVRVEGALLVKRLDSSLAGQIALISDNAVYPRIELPRGEVEIVGRVVWKGGRL